MKWESKKQVFFGSKSVVFPLHCSVPDVLVLCIYLHINTNYVYSFLCLTSEQRNIHSASWAWLLGCDNQMVCSYRSRVTVKLKDKLTIWKWWVIFSHFFCSLDILGINPLNFGFLVDRSCILFFAVFRV